MPIITRSSSPAAQSEERTEPEARPGHIEHPEIDESLTPIADAAPTGSHFPHLRGRRRHFGPGRVDDEGDEVDSDESESADADDAEVDAVDPDSLESDDVAADLAEDAAQVEQRDVESATAADVESFDDSESTDEPESTDVPESVTEDESDSDADPKTDTDSVTDAESTDATTVGDPEPAAATEQDAGPEPATSAKRGTDTATKPESAQASADSAPDAAPEPGAPVRGPGGIRRVLALDGLRGIAVISVVVYHCFGNVMRGGYLGVDIFFVLSGFLITSLLVREFGATGTTSVGEFWRRRARRILPAAVTVLVVCTAVAGLIGGDVAVQLVPQFFSSLFFVNNWVQIAESHSYFADTAPQIFMHYWSLAIEEQFYVVWPLLFFGVMWLCRRKGIRIRLWTGAALAVGLGAASAATMAVLYDSGTDPSRVYFGTDTHAFGLLAGAALALVVTSATADVENSWPRAPRARRVEIASWTVASLAFVTLVVALFALPDTASLTYQGGLVGSSLLTVAVVYSALGETGPVAWLLRADALRWLGARSFSLYLWHWPVMLFARDLLGGTRPDDLRWPGWLIGAVAVVVALALSELSYRYIETPFRRRGLRGVIAWLAGASKAAVPGAIVAVVLAITMLAGSALGRSPDKTELEQSLDQLAQLQLQANTAAPARAPRPRATSRVLPLGTEISGIGDSVMLASSQALRARFPGMYIDAQVSRHYTGGEAVIQDLTARRALRKYVVLGFGTNGQAFDGQLDRIVREIGPGHEIVLLVPYGPVDGIPQAARQVLRYAPRHPNVYLAPWCQSAATHQQNLGVDGVHPFGRGVWLYADAVTEGLRQAVAGKRNPNISCPL